MATEVIEGQLHVVALDKKEAADLIGLLAALLAGKPLQGNMSGAVPVFNIVEHGVVKYRLGLTLEPDR